jgi:hypothetical protein
LTTFSNHIKTYKGHIWRGGCIYDVTMSRDFNSTYYKFTRLVFCSRSNGCIRSCIPIILVVTKTWKKIQCSFDNHQDNFFWPKEIVFDAVWFQPCFELLLLIFKDFHLGLTWQKILSWQWKIFWCEPINQVVENFYSLLDFWKQNLGVHQVAWTCCCVSNWFY